MLRGTRQLLSLATPVALVVALALATGCGGGGGGSATLEPVVIPTPVVAITTSSLGPANLGVAYSATIQATGGKSPFAWSFVDPAAAPPGLALTASTTTSVALEGTPSAAGTFTFDVRIRDAQSVDALRRYTISVAAALSITTASLGPAEEDVAYSATIDSVGGVAPYTWRVVDPQNLPPGISLATSRVASVDVVGSTTAPGTYGFVVEVTDFRGRSVQKAYTIDVGNTFRLYFTADIDDPNYDELYYSVFRGGSVGTPRKVSSTIIPNGGNVALPQTVNGLLPYAVSPDGKKVAYVADAEVNDQFDLYVVDVSGLEPGVPQKVNTFVNASNPDVQDFSWSPDSKKLAFRANALTTATQIFWADVSAAGPIVQVLAQPTNVAGTQAPGNRAYEWSPDSRFLATRGTQSSQQRLWVVDTLTAPFDALRVDQPAANAPFPPSVKNVLWSSPSTLIFVGTQSPADARPANSSDDIFTVTVTATVATPTATISVRIVDLIATLPVTTFIELGAALSNPNFPTRRGYWPDISSDGTRLAFMARRIPNPNTDFLLVSPLVNGIPTGVTLVAADVAFYDWIPGTNRIIYNTNAQPRWNIVDMSGTSPGTRVILTGAPQPGSPSSNPVEPAFGNFGLSSDRRKFFVNTGVPPFFNPGAGSTYVMDVAGAAPGPLQELTSSSSQINSQAVGLSPDGTQYAFLRHPNGNWWWSSVYLSDISGFSATIPLLIYSNKPQGQALTNSFFDSLTWTPDSKFLLFRGNIENVSQERIYIFDVLNGIPITGVQDITPALASPTCNGILNFKIVD